jgi:hypothetical protein
MMSRLFVLACIMLAVGWGALIANKAVIAGIFILAALLAVFVLEWQRLDRDHQRWADTELDDY